MLNQDWMTDIKLVECDENEGADLLARRGFSYGLGVHFLSKEDVAVLLQDDYTDVVCFFLPCYKKKYYEIFRLYVLLGLIIR